MSLNLASDGSATPADDLYPAHKRHGVHYTPGGLARFVARRALASAGERELVVLDPACGAGELLAAVASEALAAGLRAPHLVGIDRDREALRAARKRLRGVWSATCSLHHKDFLSPDAAEDEAIPAVCDLVISNPPYVRTQVLGAERARALGKQFDLSGRVDLYQAFVAAMTSRLSEGGVLGLLCSNRFMTTRGGLSLRTLLVNRYEIAEVWDLGDTKLFEAAVLPAVVVARRIRRPERVTASFVRVYEGKPGLSAERRVDLGLLDVLEDDVEGRIEVAGRVYEIERGELSGTVPERPWRLTCARRSGWLTTVKRHTSGRFGDMGRIRVGIKTTADSVFIRSTWEDLPLGQRPEDALIRPLLTHRVAERWRAREDSAGARSVLYPHEMRAGRRRPVSLSRFPGAAAYLEQHRRKLEGRKYVIEAGREWYEMWVPHHPNGWAAPKLVWPDISDRPKFFLDRSGAVVNGDCYWLSCGDASKEDVALAMAVANSSFALSYYDRCCGNRLYAGRRRFITQYLEGLPIPEVSTAARRDIAKTVKKLQSASLVSDPQQAALIDAELDVAVWELFGLKQPAR